MESFNSETSLKKNTNKIFKKLLINNQNSFEKCLQLIENSFIKFQPLLTINTKKLNLSTITAETFCCCMQVFFKETTPLSLKLICDDIKYDFDTTLNEDTIQINCRSLFSNLLVKHKKIENIRIKNLLKKYVISFENYLSFQRNKELLNKINIQIQKNLDSDLVTDTITVFQNELSISNEEITTLTNFLNSELSILLNTENEYFVIWNDGNQNAINIQILNLLKDLILLNNIDILKQLNVNENYDLKKSQSSKNIPPIVKIPNETKVEQNKEFIWEDDSKENCKLCSRFNQINERPNSDDDDIVVNKHGTFQYRIVYHQNGHLMTVLSKPIKYCPICGRKLEI